MAMAMIALPGVAMHAQAVAAPAVETHAKGDIAGDWQGTINAGKSLRVIVRVTKAEKGWGAKFYSIDQTPQPIPVSSITMDGTAVKFTVDAAAATFTGTLSADGNTIAGTWAQGPGSLPLTLIRATKETAWEVPAPPPPVKRMAADANPSFDVATIKPNDSGGSSMQQLTLNGRNFQTRNSSLEDLICFAYDVQKKQIVNAPDWIAKDRYDIAGVPDTEGAPSMVQLKGMIQKLLTERFKLTFHHDKRDMSAFVLTVAKTGQKMTVDESKGPLPGFGFGPSPAGLNMIVQNASMKDFSGVLQAMVLDRPVVDQTALEGKFDFTLKFTPDDSQFNGHPPPLPAKTDSTESSPSLFDAVQQQLGLKLEAQKTAVDVLAVDHAEKPSGN
jgi:uncharacterized protein (TIGR03435 family)